MNITQKYRKNLKYLDAPELQVKRTALQGQLITEKNPMIKSSYLLRIRLIDERLNEIAR